MTTRLYSNELKALVVPESILEQPNVGLWSHATSGDGVHHPTERYC